MNRNKTLFMTGVSSGFGHALAQESLAAGHRVIGTVRNQPALEAFEALSTTHAHAVMLDVTDFARIESVVAQVETAHGPVDVLVNNAGYGHEGILEESPLDEMRRQFDVNVFGAVAVIKAFLPMFRKRRSGHILNITSMGGTITMPGITYYCGSKFALEGISDTLSKELRPFNVFVTAVAPGSFRTDWAGRSMQRTPRSIADYDASFDPVRKARQDNSGRQPGDPRKAARAMLRIMDSPKPPAHLLLGSDALERVRDGPGSALPKSMYASPMDDSLRASTLRFLEAMTDPREARILGPSLVREIYYRVLTGEQGGSLRAALNRQGHFGRIARVIRKIHTSYQQRLDVEALAQKAGMSTPSFHVHFRGVTNASPMQYLKSTRLHQARLLMLHHAMTASGAAFNVGYESASQFSREIKRFFGRTPRPRSSG